MNKAHEEVIRRIRISRGTMSQAQLATQSGVSNKTISEYERGHFGKTRRPRPDVLARLAIALGENPADWLRLAELEYDSAQIEHIQRQLLLRHDESPLWATLGSRTTNTLEELRTARNPVVRVSYVATNTYGSFDREHIQLLCSLINHRWLCEFRECSSFSEEAALLYAQEDRCHVAVGSLETLERIATGLRFIPYPGLEHQLNGVWSTEARVPLTWNDLREQKKDILAVTIKDEAGDQYLRAICGYSEAHNNIVSTNSHELPAIFDLFREQLNDRSKRPVVLCAVEDVCYRVVQRRGNLPLQLLADGNSSQVGGVTLPRYKPGIIVRNDDPDWAAILYRAQEASLRSAPTRLARLYARLLVQLIPIEAPTDHGYSFGRLYNLGVFASSEFLQSIEVELRQLLPERAFVPDEYERILDHVLREATCVRGSTPEIEALLQRTQTLHEILVDIQQRVDGMAKDRT